MLEEEEAGNEGAATTKETTATRKNTKAGKAKSQPHAVNRVGSSLGSNVAIVKHTTLHASDESITGINKLTEQLQVTRSSLVDIAIRELLSHTPELVVELLQKHGHLTTQQAEYIYTKVLPPPPPTQPSQAKPTKKESRNYQNKYY